MAIIRLAHEGYGQLELNQVAFRRDGRIEAQCAIGNIGDKTYIENGMILAIDQATRTVGYPKGGDEFLALNYTTEHEYDERNIGLKTYKLDKGTFYPRLGYLATGDKFTTNCVSYDDASEIDDICATAAYGHAYTDGSILVNNTKEGAILKVVKLTTMPDGQAAIKFIAL